MAGNLALQHSLSEIRLSVSAESPTETSELKNYVQAKRDLIAFVADGV